MTRTALESLGGRHLGDGVWNFDLGRELHGAFGGAFGGVLAAVSVLAASELAPGRRPAGVDCRFVRGLPAGPAAVHTAVVVHGRTMTCVSIDISGSDDRLATTATATFVDPLALEPLESAGSPPRTPPHVAKHADGKPWREPPGVSIPILHTFDPRGVGRGDLGIATSIIVPWSDPPAAAAAACLAADMAVGPPVDVALTAGWVPHPNPDLSLRFADPSPTPTMVGHGRLDNITAGLATVRVEVWSGTTLAAIGVASSLLLRTTRQPEQPTTDQGSS